MPASFLAFFAITFSPYQAPAYWAPRPFPALWVTAPALFESCAAHLPDQAKATLVRRHDLPRQPSNFHRHVFLAGAREGLSAPEHARPPRQSRGRLGSSPSLGASSCVRGQIVRLVASVRPATCRSATRPRTGC